VGLPQRQAGRRIPSQCAGARLPQPGYRALEPDFALEFRRDPKLPRSHFVPVGYSDAGWGPSYGNTDDNCRSTTGWLFQISNNTVSWRSRRQTRTAQSSAKSEYYAAADAAKEAVHLRRLMGDLEHSCIHPVEMHVDNQSAIKQSNAPVDQGMSRHVDLRSHFLREMARLGHIRCTYIPAADQRADVMTKNMPAPGFRRMRDWLGVFPNAPSGRYLISVPFLTALQLASNAVCCFSSFL
jgi:hypothetical protein